MHLRKQKKTITIQPALLEKGCWQAGTPLGGNGVPSGSGIAINCTTAHTLTFSNPSSKPGTGMHTQHMHVHTHTHAHSPMLAHLSRVRSRKAAMACSFSLALRCSSDCLETEPKLHVICTLNGDGWLPPSHSTGVGKSRHACAAKRVKNLANQKCMRQQTCSSKSHGCDAATRHQSRPQHTALRQAGRASWGLAPRCSPPAPASGPARRWPSPRWWTAGLGVWG